MRVQTQAEARTAVCPQVVLHGFSPEGAADNEYGASTIDGPTNVTQYVQSVTWMHSVQAPYETIQLELAFPGSVFQALMPGARLPGGIGRAPETGFWVVLYLPNEDAQGQSIWSAVHWGYATTLQIRAASSPQGSQTVRVSIRCESWVGVLTRNVFFIAPGSNYVRPGSSYDLRSWGEAMRILQQGSVGKPPGQSLEALFYLMACQLVPNTLAAGLGTYMEWAAERQTAVPFGDGDGAQSVPGKCYWLRDVINVVWDRETCAKYAPLRALNHKPVPGLGIGSVGASTPQSTTWQYLTSTFAPSPSIELFPSLEWPHLQTAPLTRRVVSASEEASHAYRDLNDGGFAPYYTAPVTSDELDIDWTIDLVAPLNGVFADLPLGEALGGAAPALIYRMRPTLFVPINASQGITEGQYAESAGDLGDYPAILAKPTASERVGENQANQVVSPAPNVASTHWYTWSADEVYDVTWSYNESDRVNMLFTKTPYHGQSQLETHGLLGQPMVLNADVAKHGLRLRTVTWPFLPPKVPEGHAGSLSDVATALNEELWMDHASHGHGHFFGHGSVRGVYKPWVKAGHYVSIRWSGSEWRPFDHAPGDVQTYTGTTAPSGAPGFTGYLHQVTHSVRVDARGSVTASTTMQLERVAMRDGDAVAYNYPPQSPQTEPTVILVIDPATGEQVRGRLEVSEDGELTFVPEATG